MKSIDSALLAAVRGPIFLIVLGILFLVQQKGLYPIWQTWPVLLILAGVLKLWERVVRGGSR